MNFRYNKFQRFLKIIYRKINPVPGSPWTKGYVEDICKVNLVPPETLKTFFARCFELLKEIKGNNIGDYLEFGVFNGSSIGSAYLTAKKLNIKSINFFGFDSFEGLPSGTNNEHDVLQEGFYACSFEKTKECLIKRNINPKEITWIKGWYSKTINHKTVKKYQIDNIGVVFIDCDTYSSSKTVLNFLAPLIIQPAIFCFDDWKLYNMDLKETGEYKSFNEFLENNPHLEAKEIKSYNRKSKSFLIKPIRNIS